MIKLYYERIVDQAFMPEKAHESDMGIDFRSIEDLSILPHSVATVHTGLRIAFDWSEADYGMSLDFSIGLRMASKSGLAVKNGVIIVGEIDQEYRGELIIILFNSSKRTFHVKKGDKIAQGILELVPKVSIEEVEELDTNTERGEGGFGSTDVIIPTLKPHTDYGDLFTIKDFIESCESGGFVDYDGHGYLATKKQESNLMIVPSQITKNVINIDPKYTHVKWYNK